MATYSSILGWKIPWTEGPGGLQSMASQKSRTQLSERARDSMPHSLNHSNCIVIWQSNSSSLVLSSRMT